jgi:hypothetical protein
MTKVETSLLDVKLIGDFASFANKEKETEKKILKYWRTGMPGITSCWLMVPNKNTTKSLKHKCLLYPVHTRNNSLSRRE